MNLRNALVSAVACCAMAPAAVRADSRKEPSLTGVPEANARAAGFAPAPKLSAELRQIVQAQGSTALENPAGIIGWYGYENEAPSPDDATLPQMVPGTRAPLTEAQKTEPDKNTYLVLRGQTGADPSYDYGTHFLFQGHEASARNAAGRHLGLVTRINLDADAAHRVTLLATHDVDGNPLENIDGSTWDPFAQRLLFTTENANAPTYAATATFPSQVEDVSG